MWVFAHSPLHSVGYLLDPKFLNLQLEIDQEVMVILIQLSIPFTQIGIELLNAFLSTQITE